MDSRVDTFLEKYRDKRPEYLLDLERYARDNHIPVMGRGTADLLRYLLHTVRPEKVLEIGTAIGYSALYMRNCAGYPLQITTIEKIDTRYELAEENFSKYDEDGSITLIKEDAVDAVQRLAEAGETYGIIFLDAAKGQYVNFLPHLVKMLPTDGVLVSDNIFHGGAVLNSRYAVNQRDRTIHERMREFLQMITEHEELESICFPVDDGVAVSKKVEKS